MPFQANVLTGPEVLVAAGAKQFDDEGRLITDSYIGLLDELMKNLRSAAEA